MVDKPKEPSTVVDKVSEVLENPSLYPTALSLVATLHLSILGWRLHEPVLASEFILIAAAGRAFPLLPISRQIRFLRSLISAGLSFLSALSACADASVHTWKDLFAGSQQHWAAVLILAFLSSAAEKVAEHKHSSRLKTTIPMGDRVLRGKQESLFELKIEERCICQFYVRISPQLSTPLYRAEIRDTNNRRTICRLNCDADLATCELTLERGRYFVRVKKLDPLQLALRVTAHAVARPHSSSSEAKSHRPSHSSKENDSYAHQPLTITLDAHEVSRDSIQVEDSTDLQEVKCPENLQGCITRRTTDLKQAEDEIRRRAEEDGIYS